jgi:uncharacterized protein (TIGR02246 family)
MRANRVDAAEVRAVEAAYDDAWSAGDLDHILNCLAADVVMMNPRGEVAVGKDQARTVLSAFLSGEAQGTEHRSNINRVSFLGEDVAVVDGVATITRGAGTVLVRHPFTDVLARSSDGWRIAHVRAYTLMGQ